jgi:anthranilate phosphoribosyltransferase
MKQLLAAVAERRNLTREEAAAAMRVLMAGEASPAVIAAFLTALKLKGETVEEIVGFARVMRECSLRLAPRCERVVDTCGTGGGAIPTFNISTTAAFVVAGAGVPVAKHGNRAMTSACGSADVLEALGVRIDLSPEEICACIEEIGIGFMFAQAHHPAMRHVGPIRRELPFRTVFNCLGPLTNPAGAPAQVIGVYEERLVPLLAEALGRLGCDRGMVVYGSDGLDELSTVGETLVAKLGGGEVRQFVVRPEDVGLARAQPEDLAPGDSPAANAELTLKVLGGQPGPRRDIVLLNAAATLTVAGKAADLRSAIGLAAQSIDSGRALQRLEALRARTGDRQ